MRSCWLENWIEHWCEKTKQERVLKIFKEEFEMMPEEIGYDCFDKIVAKREIVLDKPKLIGKKEIKKITLKAAEALILDEEEDLNLNDWKLYETDKFEWVKKTRNGLILFVILGGEDDDDFLGLLNE